MNTKFSLLLPVLASTLFLCIACRNDNSSTGTTTPPDGTPVAVEFINAFPALSFDSPLFLTAVPGGNRLAVVTQEGIIYTFDNNPQVQQTDVLLDIRNRVVAGGEMGLLGLAFDANFVNNGYFYVNYTTDNPRRTVIARYHAVNGTADPATETILLDYEQPFSNHNGGMLAFGSDGKLYIGSGDGGSGNDPQNNAQSLDTLLGKILRINTEPGNIIPVDNPFVSNPNARGEIWAYGLRNPWRFSFDRATGTLWVGDVGQNAIEEIDIIVKGGNYGWRIYEGNRENNNPNDIPASQFIAPVYTYSHDLGQSITGGYVYRGAAIPGLRGDYIYADFISGNVWALDYMNGQVYSNTLIAEMSLVSSFGEDAEGELYITSFNGSVYKLVAQ